MSNQQEPTFKCIEPSAKDLEFFESQDMINGAVKESTKKKHRWQVAVLRDCYAHAVIEYDGDDYDEAIKCVGGHCLNVLTDKVFVSRDYEKYRHIEVR